MNSRPYATLTGSRRANRGAVLIISLIVLVAMTMGGLAILRSVDTTTLIAGNLAFKQRALHAADTGVTQALTWLLANKATLQNDNAGEGYFSSQPFDWTNAASWGSAKVIGTDAGGNRVSYIIHRMCTCANIAYNGTCGGTANQCGIDNPSVSATPKPVEGDTFQVGGVVFPSTGSVYYRVTVKSEGPRNTESYIQAMVTIAI